MRTTGMALASSSGSPIVKMLAKMLEVLLCSASSSAMASGTWVTRAIAVTAASSSHVSRFDRTIMPTSSSHASAKYAARIQAASSNVDCDGLSTKTTSAIGGTATSEMNSSTGQLRSAGFLIHSPKGNNDPIAVPPGQILINRVPAHRRDPGAAAHTAPAQRSGSVNQPAASCCYLVDWPCLLIRFDHFMHLPIGSDHFCARIFRISWSKPIGSCGRRANGGTSCCYPDGIRVGRGRGWGWVGEGRGGGIDSRRGGVGDRDAVRGGRRAPASIRTWRTEEGGAAVRSR